MLSIRILSFTNKELKDLLETLDEIKKEAFTGKKEYPFSEWDKNRKRVKERFEKLPELIERAADSIAVGKKVGRPKDVDLRKRLSLFLFVRTMDRSNRDTESILVLLASLFGFEVNYKYVEGLYSDEEVKLALHNLLVLLLEEESSGKISVDGTGYSLSIARHYRTSPKKEGKNYVYVFRAIDLETGLYVALGYSSRSESEAFRKALRMLKGVEIDSIALDRYYSSRSVLRIFGAKTSVYVIPKKSICNFGVGWMRVLKNIIKPPAEFLKSYFKRNLSEYGFSSDKRRFGWLETDAPLAHPRFCCAKSIASRREGVTEESLLSSVPRSCTAYSL